MGAQRAVGRNCHHAAECGNCHRNSGENAPNRHAIAGAHSCALGRVSFTEGTGGESKESRALSGSRISVSVFLAPSPVKSSSTGEGGCPTRATATLERL